MVNDASREEILSSTTALPIREVKLERQMGPAAARNEGLKRAANPYILFLDADMVLPHQSIDWIRDTLELYSHRPDVAGVLGVYAETVPWKDFYSNFKNLYTCFLYNSTETQSPFLHTPIFCVKKDVLKAAGGFDPDLATAEDFRLGLLLGTQGHRFIIDRRIQGTHLKRYSLASILREDFRRTRDLGKIKLQGAQRKFYYRAHRWHRLISLLLPGPILILSLLSFWNARLPWVVVFFLAVFYLCNLRFLMYCRRVRGLAFALKAAAFLFIEMLWAEVCVVGLTSRSK